VICLATSERTQVLAPNRSFLFAVSAYFLVVLSGCTGLPAQDTETIVRSRAQAWLDALMDFDIDGIYSFTSPAYQSAHSARFYSKNYAGRNMWRSAELGEISCDQADAFGVCAVKVLVTYQGFNMREEMTTALTETWVQVDGVWYSQPRL
jgi:hypothetical protein